VAKPLDGSIYNVKRMALWNQVYIIVYSIILALVGRGKILYLLIILFIIISLLISSRRGKTPLGTKKSDVMVIMSSRKLFEEKNTREYQTKDSELINDIQEQSKFSMYLSIGTLIALVYFFVLWSKINNIAGWISSYVGPGKLALFLAFLLYFEGYSIIYTAFQVYALKKVKNIVVYTIPTSYIVTEKGIIYKGLLSNTAIEFPLPPDIEINYNTRRGFVELIKKDKKIITKLRLYTRNPSRLASLIEKIGMKR
jgi:uncharacterized membrane protein